MTIKNRQPFLENIAQQLGRPLHTSAIRPQWQHTPQKEVLAGATQEQLVEILQKQCQNIHTTCVMTTKADLPSKLSSVIEQYGNESIITWQDERYEKLGLTPLFQALQEKGTQYYIWHETNHKENIEWAARANISIMVSEMTLAESGTAMLYSDRYKGRTMTFLPKQTIILIPKSSIVPRITQAATHLHELVMSGEEIPSCITFVTGPSNSADIEMVLIVGVHGPIKATYIIIEDA